MDLAAAFGADASALEAHHSYDGATDDTDFSDTGQVRNKVWEAQIGTDLFRRDQHIRSILWAGVLLHLNLRLPDIAGTVTIPGSVVVVDYVPSVALCYRQRIE